MQKNFLLYPISIVVPVYNEADNVGKLWTEIVYALPLSQFLYEIIFVNDGSNDDTQNYLRLLLEKDHNIILITHCRNYGQSAALISGVNAAKYPLIVTIDGDGQNDPADIPLLIEKYDASDKNAVIYGNRVRRHDNWSRRQSARIANYVRRMLLRDTCPDAGCSLKLFPKEAFLSLPRFNHFHRFLPSLFMREGLNSICADVNHRPRLYGKSKYTIGNRLWAGIVDLIGVMWLLRRPCKAECKQNI